MFSILMINILITDEINICIFVFSYYAEKYTLETNFSHVISADSYTEAASWIVQLSSDSPDINIILDPNQVYMNIQTPTSSTLSASKVNNILTPTLSASITTSNSSSCEPTLQQLGIYIGAALFALFLLTLTICVVAISFCCVYHKHKVLQDDVDSCPSHPTNTYINEAYSDVHQNCDCPLQSLPDNET